MSLDAGKITIQIVSYWDSWHNILTVKLNAYCEDKDLWHFYAVTYKKEKAVHTSATLALFLDSYIHGFRKKCYRNSL